MQKYKFYLLFLGIGFFVYFNSLFGSFVWDDVSLIQDNFLVHSVSNIPSFFLGRTVASQNGTIAAGSYYRPLGFSIIAFIYTLSGGQTFLFHLIQLCIHIFNTTLLFIFLKKFFKEKLAFFISLFFLIHPINTESVDYISALDDPLLFLFGISALLLFEKAKTKKTLIFIGFLLLCSLFAKETGIVFLILVIFYALLFKGGKNNLVNTSLITALPLSIYIFMRFIIAKMPLSVEKIPDVPMMTASFAQRFYTMPAILWYYIKTFFFPKNLLTFQEWMIPGLTSDFYLSLLQDLLFIFGLTAFGIWIWKTNKKYIKIYIFFCIWLILGIGFHLQFLPLDMTVAERYFYFGSAGLVGLLGLIINSFLERNKTINILILTITIVLLAILSVRTIIRNTNWYDGISLYSHDLQFEKNDRMENLLAGDLLKAGMYSQAQTHLENLLKSNPLEPTLYVNLAIVYEITGNFIKANQTYSNGLSLDDSGAVYSNYARFLLEREEKTAEAKKVTEKGLLKFSQNSNLWLIQAVCEYKLGEKQKAILDAKKAQEISPNFSTQKIYDEIINNQPL